MRGRAIVLAGVLLLSASFCALAAGSKQVGQPGAWKATIAGVGMGGKLYTVESSGVLYVTDPASGSWKAIGKPEFKNTRFLFASGGMLYTIEKDGSLYVVSPADGSWKRLGQQGAWKATIAGVGAGGKLYTVESSGVLYVTDLSSGAWKAIGKPEFGNTAFLFEAGGKLYTIEKDGSLYAVSPLDGSWKRLGQQGAWKATVAGVGMGGKLYTVETSGVLYVTDLSSGAWSQVGSGFSGTRYVLSAEGRLSVIDGAGSLFLVAPN
jgi:predicted secreted protein